MTRPLLDRLGDYDRGWPADVVARVVSGYARRTHTEVASLRRDHGYPPRGFRAAPGKTGESGAPSSPGAKRQAPP